MTGTCTSSKAPRAATCPRASEAAAARAAAGFTLLELMVALAGIGRAMSVMVTGSKTLLPQTRLRGSADRLVSALESARTWAVLEGHTLEFCYDLENRSCAFWLPYETDE